MTEKETETKTKFINIVLLLIDDFLAPEWHRSPNVASRQVKINKSR